MQSDNSRRRILFVDLGATFGGAEIYLLRLLQALRTEADCLVLCSDAELQARLRDLDVAYVSMSTGQGLRKILQLGSALGVIAKLLVTRNIETVQINGYSEILLLPLVRLFGRRAVPTRHLSFEIEVEHWYQAPGRFAARWLYRTLAFTATQVVCVSEEVGREVDALVPGRVAVIPNWVDRVPAWTPKPAVTGDTFTVLFVGRMVAYKGLALLCEALSLLQAQKQNKTVRLIAVGDGPQRRELEAVRTEFPIHFTGFQRELSRYYAEADLFVSPSLGPEGSSLVTLEAMANGVPCLLSDIAVHREIARDGVLAALYRSGDAVDLAAGIDRLREENAVRNRYAARAHAAIVAEHNGDRALESYRRVLAIAPVHV